MRSIFRFFLLVIAMTTFGASTYAQRGNRQSITREQLAETQAKYIAKEIGLDGSVSEKFITTFCQFQKEVWALGPRHGKGNANRTDAESEQALKERFAHSQKLLDLRQKYYEEYSKFLTQTQIMRVYEMERKMMTRMYHRSHKNRERKH